MLWGKVKERRKTRSVKVGKVIIGGDSPVVVQGMTKTSTENISATLRQIIELEEAGARIVRIALPHMRAVKALSKIRKKVKLALVGDVHFNPELAIAAISEGIDKIRINPGNIGKEGILRIAEAAKGSGVPLRVGVNSGSLKESFLPKLTENKRRNPTQKVAQAMVRSALETVTLLEEDNFQDIIVSLKSPYVLTTILSCQLISQKIPYPLHLGITATGPPPQGIIRSASGIAILLAQGIGDTIRVSLTSDPVQEVKTAYQIMRSLDFIKDRPTLISCPTCGRCQIDLISVVNQVASEIEELKLPLTVAVMGCEVNGPGEAREADIGIACGRKGALLFKKGKVFAKVEERNLAGALLSEVTRWVQEEGRGKK
ncbi:4-hydroxy-3-methylbut-2-en-1-yl diphosphate synthase (flavodoxin) [subsurface metagenome]